MVPLTMAGGLLLAGVFTDQIFATPIPQNLSHGLRDIVEKQSAPRQAAPATTSATQQPSLIKYDRLKMIDAQNRVLVNTVLNGKASLPTIQSRITALGGNVTASDSRYRAGVIEAFVSPAQAVEIAKMDGVSAVHLVPKPVNNIGKATTRGIVQHRIDKVPAGINGAGITVGVLSDSYNLARLFGGPVKAGDDVASGDLPGRANPFGHTQPVVVLQEGPVGADEGRAMLQIVHDIAPQARLGFATAFTGEVGFADNIRSLARLPSGSLSRPGFKADVIIDDVIYLDEPMFQDGIVAQAVDDVAAAGVAYFSSAGNRPASQAYDSALRLIPAFATALAGTNLDLGGVDPALYKGGFHNFATGAAQDIAQTIHIDEDGIIVFQWNEPFDSTPPTLGNVLQSGSGTLTSAMPTETFPFAGTAGQHIGIIADAAPGSSDPLADATITLIGPQGNEIAFQDATTNPEVLISFLPVTGTYKIRIGGFSGTTGDFVYEVRQASGTQSVKSDFNLLFFDANGQFLGALDEKNRATNRPIEIGELLGTFDVQMVIARANTPAAGIPAADRLRYVWFNGGQPQEFIDYRAPATYGHNSAVGANGVAAYAFYPPFIPESFTSPGPVTIYFDKNNNRLPQPEVRLKPDMAAMDGADTTFFGADAPQDPKGRPNFFGTSAAAPHAGGIAALMLQAAGGRGSLAPTAVRQTLQSSAFSHDLDPN
ncbi:MAG: S8 family serine peptidase, partial [Pseudomonadota bacterium]|nr:S8 family serine peptidase [Pseudomonadota bacterium]